MHGDPADTPDMKIGSTLTQRSLFGQTTTTSLFQGQMALDSKAVDGFAEELTRRAKQGADPQSAQTVDDQGLTQAMTGAVDWVKDNLGSNAARAVMGIVMGGSGDGALTEDSLGDGLVKALQFIDNTFGTKIGDQAIGVFNGQLNQAMNGYFQNGHDESFLAMDLDTAMSQASAAMGEVVSQFFKNTQGNTADARSSLLEQAEKDRREQEAETQARLEAKQQAQADAQAQARDASLEASGRGAVTDQVQAAARAAAQAAQSTVQATAAAASQAAAQTTVQAPDQTGARGSGQGADPAQAQGQASAQGSSPAPSPAPTVQAVGDAGQVQLGETVQAAPEAATAADQAVGETSDAKAQAARTQEAQATPTVSMARVRRLSRRASSLRGYSSSSLPTGVLIQATA